MSKKVLVLGSSGMLGFVVFKYIQSRCIAETRGIARRNPYHDPFIHNVDITNKQDVRDFIEKYKPTDIINCLGVIPQNNPTKEEYEYINHVFPRWISDAYPQIKFIQASTDCVYNGKPIDGRGFNLYNTLDDFGEKHANPAENDYYGWSKLNFDYDCEYQSIILRGSIIGPTYKNIGSGLFNFVVNNRGKEVNGYINHYWNGNTTLQFAKIAADIIMNDTPFGVYQLGNSQIINKAQLIEFISDEFNLNVKVNPFETEEDVDRTISYSEKFVLPSLSTQLKEFRLWVNEEKFPIW